MSKIDYELPADLKPDYELIGQRIRTARKLRKLSQRQLAELIRLSEENMSRIETGRLHPSLETLYHISRVLNVTPNDLLGCTAQDNEMLNELHGFSEQEKQFLLASLRHFACEYRRMKDNRS